jgi:tetratricopeptide (TPR) repeat protein
MQNRYFLSAVAFCTLVAPELRALQRTPTSCEQYHAAVRANPDNLDAAVSLGRCTVRDEQVIAPNGDSTQMAFRTSWTPALRALRHAVEVNPSYAPAYRLLFRMLFAEMRDGCSYITMDCRHVAPVVRAGDSVLTIPRPVRLNEQPDTYDEVSREWSETGRRENLTEARALAERWAAVAPNDRRPHEYLGQALLRLGEAAAASAQLEHAAALGTPESRRDLFWDRTEAFIRTDRGADARRVLDEAVSDAGRDTLRLANYTVAALNAFLGRYRPPPVDAARARESQARLDSILRSRPPTPPPSRSPDFSAVLAGGDTNEARRILARTDSLLQPKTGMTRSPAVDESSLYSAGQHLALGDTAGALARLEDIERPLTARWFPRYIGLAYGAYRPWTGRAWLLTGDVAAAQGRLEDARRMYRRVIGLWGGGDADQQPVVDQARARLGSLSAR